ncbi:MULTISPECIES: metallophosphoesterase [Deinococcus]|uniref:Metallophosphoesterase n=1 Tax=Deinococcus rufus TaxID=2136097 RepID=A0ABV7Z984_9DEIO|nr:metallophosphoesterase [Deinococcus sp. AB2017081]WQE94592.1 metallophosphoesterase [Deinococcus sp. AB2017081]
MTPLWVVGDIHGAYEPLIGLLRTAGLIDHDGSWQGGTAHLAFLGDYVDRGPRGMEVIHLIRRLTAQAHESGGHVTALLGNHEVMFLAAQHFRATDPADSLGFREYWRSNGGQDSDAAQLQITDLDWLRARPALSLAGDWLLMHADSTFYRRLGRTPDAVNRSITALLHEDNPKLWTRFLNHFADRLAFVDPDAPAVAADLLQSYGGTRLVHGHTPVYVLHDELQRPGSMPVPQPITYVGGQCVAVDSGMAYLDGAGFIVRLDDSGVAQVVTLDDDLGDF